MGPARGPVGGFPWLRVAGRDLTGVTVVDLDATIVFAASGKDKAVAAYEGGLGFLPGPGDVRQHRRCPGDRPAAGNAASKQRGGNIAALDTAISRLPGAFRRRPLVRPDGAGFSHELPGHIAAGGGEQGRRCGYCKNPHACPGVSGNASCTCADWPWTTDLINAWHAVRALPAPS